MTKLVDKGYQPHLEDFLLRINLNNYYKDSWLSRVCVCERTLRTSCFRMCVYRQSCLMNSNQVVRWRFNPQKLNDVMCKIKYFIFRLLSHDSYVRNGHKALLKSFTFWKDDTWAESDSPITAAHHVDEWFYFSAYIMLKLIAG